ncbi:MAG: EamA/RhaT family transporter [Alphaproteobacteria bacterium]|nr:MAG: EamA/RhaT family transporter [Alphaproteobacteria bacterium]
MIRQSPASGLGRSMPLAGIGWMLLTGLLFVGVTGIVRHLGSDMGAGQAAFVRYAFGLILLMPVFVYQRPPGGFVSRRIGLHALRGLVHGAAVMLWFYAMARIPIAQVTALGFTAPIFTTVGAALFLGERLQARRIGAVLIAFAGALIILRPGLVAINPGALAQLAAAPLFATSFLLAKKLTETEPSATIVAYMAVFVTLALLPPALVVWRPPTPEELVWLCATAVLATLGHYTLTRAFRAADITVTQPFSFLQLVWATLLGFYLFGERPDVWTWIGGAIIVASATYIAHRESRRREDRGRAA